MIDRLLLKISDRHRLSDEEAEALRATMRETRRFDRDEVIVEEGVKRTFSCLLLEGMSARSKYTEGGDRQIMELNVSGDFVDLHSFPLERLEHSVTALSPCEIALLPHAEIERLIDRHPRLGRILWFSTMVDASIHREWIVSLGQRPAIARMAHLFCEIYYRLRVVELNDGLSYELPLTQRDLGECLGLTTVHVNRMLRELRSEELATFRSRTVTIEDLPALERVGGFDPEYLYLQPRDY